MPVPYFLTSKRLSFRDWRQEDLPLAVTLWGDPAVTALIGGPFSAQQGHTRLQREIESNAISGLQYWPMFLTGTNAFVGCCGLRPYRPHDGVLELGFHLIPSHWGQGLASEAAHATVRHAFNVLGAAALFAGHHPENHVSEHLLRRIGFQYTHRELYQPTGLEHPSYMLRPSDYIPEGRA